MRVAVFSFYFLFFGRTAPGTFYFPFLSLRSPDCHPLPLPILLSTRFYNPHIILGCPPYSLPGYSILLPHINSTQLNLIRVSFITSISLRLSHELDYYSPDIGFKRFICFITKRDFGPIPLASISTQRLQRLLLLCVCVCLSLRQNTQTATPDRLTYWISTSPGQDLPLEHIVRPAPLVTPRLDALLQ